MFFFIFSAVALDLNNYIDGLENVRYQYNSIDQSVEIKVEKQNIFLYYQNVPDLKITMINEKETVIKSNGYKIPAGSTISIKAYWGNYDDYLVGFIDGNNCDYIYYTSSNYKTFPMFAYSGKKICFYHLTKDSSITIGSQNYNKIARVIAKNEIATIKSSKNGKDEVDDNGFILKKNSKKNILKDDEFNYSASKNKFTYASGYIMLALGALFYLGIGLFLGSECCKCCSCSKYQQKLINFVDNRDNGFYTKTLKEFGDWEPPEENDQVEDAPKVEDNQNDKEDDASY